MHRQQRGVTMIGWVFLLAPVALVGYAGIRLAPMFINYGKVARTMEQVASQSRSDDTLNANLIRIALEKRLDIEGIEFPDVKDFAIRKDGPAWVIDCNYEDTQPYLSNVSLLVTFRKTVRIGRAPSAE